MDEYIAENGGLVVAPEPRPLNMSYRSSSYFGPPEPQEQALALPDPSAIHWDAQRLEYEAGPHSESSQSRSLPLEQSRDWNSAREYRHGTLPQQ